MSEAEARRTSYETYKALPAADTPYTDEDFDLIEDIIRAAENQVRAEGGDRLTLLKILRSYDQILRARGHEPAEDTYFYRLLLKLSLDAEVDWWSKVVRARRKAARSRISHLYRRRHFLSRSFRMWNFLFRRKQGNRPIVLRSQLPPSAIPSVIISTPSTDNSMMSTRIAPPSILGSQQSVVTGQQSIIGRTTTVSSGSSRTVSSGVTRPTQSLHGTSSRQGPIVGASQQLRQPTVSSGTSHIQPPQQPQQQTLSSTGGFSYAPRTTTTNPPPPLPPPSTLSSNQSVLGTPMTNVTTASSLRLGADDEEAFQNFRKLAATFRRWRRNVKFIRYSRRARDQALAKWLRAVQHWEKQTCIRAMKAFKVVFGERMKKNQNAEQLYKRNLQIRMLWSLHRAVQDRKQKPFLVLRAMQQWNNFTQRLAWHAWRGVVFATRDRVEAMAHRKTMRILTGAWNRWRADFQKLQKADLFQKQCQRRLLLRVVQPWVARHRRLQLLQSRARLCQSNVTRRELRATWARWNDSFASKRTRRIAKEIIARWYGRVILKDCLEAWRRAKVERVYTRLQVRKLQQHFGTRARGTLFMQWLDVVKRREAARDVAVTVSQRSLLLLQATALRRWREALLLKLDNEDAQAQAGYQRVMSVRVRQVLLAWRHVLKQQHLKRRLQQVVTSRHVLQTLVDVWTIWRDEYKRSLKQRIIAGKHRIASMRHHFMPWLMYASMMAHRKRTLRKLHIRRLSYFMLDVLTEWRRATRKGIMEHTAAARVMTETRLNDTRRVLNAWKSIYNTKSGERNKRVAILALVRHNVIANAMRLWTEAFEKRRLSKHMEGIVTSRAHNNMRRAAFRGWYFAYRLKYAQRVIGNRTQAKSLNAAWLLWRVARLQRIKFQDLRARVALTNLNTSVNHTFFYWQAYTRWAVHRRKTMQNAASSRATHILTGIFSAWRKMAHHDAVTHRKQNGFTTSRVTRALKNLFKYWQFRYAQRRWLKNRSEKGNGLHARAILLQGLHAWRDAVKRKKAWDHATSLVVQKQKLRMLRILFARWHFSFSRVFGCHQAKNVVAGRVQYRVLRDTFRHWRRTRVLKGIVAQMSKKIRQMRLQFYLDTWNYYTTHERSTKKISDLRDANRKKVMMIRWRQALTHERRSDINREEKLKMVLSAMRKRILARNLAAFRQYTIYLRHLRQASKRIARKHLAIQFRAFRATTEVLASERKKTALTVKRVNQRLVRQTLATWRAHLRQMERVDVLRGRVIRNLLRQMAHHALLAWRYYTQTERVIKQNAAKCVANRARNCIRALRARIAYKARVRAIAQHVSARRRVLSLSRPFEEWYTLLAQRTQLQEFVEHRVRKSALQVFKAWRHVVHQRVTKMRDLNKRATHVVERMRRFPIAAETAVVCMTYWRNWDTVRAFRSLRAYAEQRVKDRMLHDFVFDRTRTRTIKKFIFTWRVHLKHRRDRAAAALLYRTTTVNKCFRVLQDYVAERKRKQQVSNWMRAWHIQRFVADHLTRWRRYVQFEKQRRQLIDGFYMRHWQLWLKQIIFGWREAVRAKITEKKLVEHLRYRRNLAKSALIFAGWRTAYLRKNDLNLRCVMIASKRSHFTRLKAWRVWKEVFTLHHAQLTAIVVLQRRHAARVSRRVLRYWQVYAHQAQTLKRAVAVLRARANKRMMRSILSKFAANVRDQRERTAMKKAADKHNLMRHFRFWKNYAQSSSDIRQRGIEATEIMTRYHLNRIVATWRIWASERKQTRLINEHKVSVALESHYKKYLIPRIMVTWHNFATQRASARRMGAELLKRWYGGVARQSLLAWREFAVQNSYRNQATAQFVKLRRMRSLRSVFNAWASAAKLKRTLKNRYQIVLQRTKGLVLGATWHSWRTTFLHLTADKEWRRAAKHHREIYQMRQCWTAWRAYAERHAALKARQNELLGSRNAVIQRLAFGAWHEESIAKRAGDRMRGFLITNRLKRLFLAWRAHTVLRTDERQLIANRVEEQEQAGFRKMWNIWRHWYLQVTNSSKGIHSAIRHYQMRRIRLAFAAWRADSRHQRNKVKASAHFTHRMLQLPLIAWRQYAHKKATLQKSERIMTNARNLRIMQKMFAFWSARNSEITHDRDNNRLAEEFRTNTILHTIVRGWHAHIAHRQQLLVIAEDVNERHLSATLASCVKRWRHILWKKQSRRAADQYWNTGVVATVWTKWSRLFFRRRRVAAILAQRDLENREMMLTVFGSWFEYVKGLAPAKAKLLKKEQLAMRCLTLQQRLQHRSLSRNLHAWIALYRAKHEQRIRAAALGRRITMRDAIVRWRDYTIEEKDKQAKNLKATKFHRKHFVARMFGACVTAVRTSMAVRAAKATVEIQTRVSLLRYMFTGWADAASDRYNTVDADLFRAKHLQSMTLQKWLQYWRLSCTVKQRGNFIRQRRVFEAWRATARQQAQTRALQDHRIAVLTRKRYATLLRNWQQASHAIAERNQMLNDNVFNFQRRHARLRLRSAFATWLAEYRQVQLSSLLQRVIQHKHGLLLRKVFQGWQTALRKNRLTTLTVAFRKKHLVGKILGHLRLLLLLRQWRKQHLSTTTKRSLQQWRLSVRAVRFERQMDQRRIAKAVNAVYEFVGTRRREAQQWQRATLAFVGKLFRRWSVMSTKRRQAREVAQIVSTRHQEIVIRRAFFRWTDVKAELVQADKRRWEAAVRQHAIVREKRVFAAWKTFVLQRRRRAEWINYEVKRMEQRAFQHKLRAILRAWRAHMRVHVAAQTLQAKCTQHSMRRMLVLWRAWSRTKSAKRIRQAAVVASFRNQWALRPLFVTWRANAKAANWGNAPDSPFKNRIRREDTPHKL